MTPELYLEYGVVEISQQLYTELNKTDDPDSNRSSLEQAYLTAYAFGAIVAGLSLLHHRFVAPHRSLKTRAPTAADSYNIHARVSLEQLGYTFRLRDAAELRRIARQVTAAHDALMVSRVSGRLVAIGAESRAASYAARWGAQHGQATQATRAGVVAPSRGRIAQDHADYQAMTKIWVRTFPRTEKRHWHTALEGKRVPVDQPFILDSPKYGRLEVQFPYDGRAPWSEWIHCGHSVRYSSAEPIPPWDGSAQRSGLAWSAELSTELTPEQTAAVQLAVGDAGLTGFLQRNPLQRLDFANIKTGNSATDMAAGWTAPPTFRKHNQPYPWIVVKPVRRMDRLPMGNEVLRPGKSPAVAVMDKGVIGFMKGVFVHELGHHVLNEAGEDVVCLVAAEFAQAKPISEYAETDYQEWFCETLTAYTYYRKVLKAYDPAGYKMIRNVLKLLEV